MACWFISSLTKSLPPNLSQLFSSYLISFWISVWCCWYLRPRMWSAYFLVFLNSDTLLALLLPILLLLLLFIFMLGRDNEGFIVLVLYFQLLSFKRTLSALTWLFLLLFSNPTVTDFSNDLCSYNSVVTYFEYYSFSNTSYLWPYCYC